jgi:hypothetical protein
VVHAGDPASALATAEARLGPADRSAVALDAIRALPPSLLSGAEAAGCVTPPEADVTELISRIRTAVLFAEREQAAALVAEARAAVLCRPAPPATLARIELLAGVLAELAGQSEAARERFAVALAYDPEVAWFDALPPERRVQFDAARAAPRPPRASLRVYPGGQSVDVPAGESTVFVGGTGARVWLDPEVPDVLVVPAAYPPDALSDLDPEPRRDDLTRLLTVGIAEGVPAVVVSGDVAWVGTTGRVDWQAHRPPVAISPAPEAAVPAPPQLAPARRAPGPLVLAGTGGAAAATGILLAVTGVVAAQAAADGAVGVPPGERYDGLRTDYRSAARRAWVGYGLLGAGGLCGTVGLAWAL